MHSGTCGFLLPVVGGMGTGSGLQEGPESSCDAPGVWGWSREEEPPGEVMFSNDFVQNNVNCHQSIKEIKSKSMWILPQGVCVLLVLESWS